ncbi:MAG TPA: TrkA family potassium uptake protein, partial [Deferrimonas sp.]
MANGTCIIIGLGNIGLQLIKMLSRDFALVCIDGNQKTLDTALELRGDSLTVLQGDATSRLVLERAGVAEADTVLITTTTEAVNIEVARILHDHFQVPRVVSIGITQKGIEQLESLGVEVESIFTVSATGLRNRMEHKTKAVHGIGLGKGEILEVEVHPHSRLANKPLAALHPKSWHVGIVYREGNILIPGGDTILRPKDKVVILGDPKVLRTVTDLLTFRFTLFPLEYGDTLVALFTNGEEESFIKEIAYLLSVFPLKNAMFLLPPDSDALAERLRNLDETRTLQGLHIEEIPAGPVIETLRVIQQSLGRRVAIIVLPKKATVRTSWGRRKNPRGKRFLRNLSEAFGCPVLL